MSVFSYMYIYVLLCVLNKDHSLCGIIFILYYIKSSCHTPIKRISTRCLLKICQIQYTFSSPT